MTRGNKKKEAKAKDATDLESVKAGAASKAPKAKNVPVSLKNNKPTAAPKEQVGLLVTDELTKAIEECKTKVAVIVNGCRTANRRFRDLEFDLENDKIRCLKGLNYSGDEPLPPAVLRVTQIFSNPQFVIDGAEAIDIHQGNLGDCWLLSALSTMSTSKGLIEKLCVARDEEVGVYGFVFFRGCTWVSVIIDDQLFWTLPRYDELSSQEQALYQNDREMYNKLSQHGNTGLHFARSGTLNETWVPLIEKAYAKLHGDYQCLDGGLTSEAIEDLTGGVSMMYNTKDILNTDRFWNEELLHATVDRLFACGFSILDTSRKTGLIIENPKVNGLYGGHAYSILRVKECRGKRFIVLRNPWGESEWTGRWGDGSKEWTGEWLEVLKELNHEFGDDGEFVMEYCDFLETFELIERTTIFDSSWVMSSHWLRVPPQRKHHPWGFGDLSFSFVLNKASFTIISLSQVDSRYFEAISGVSKWNIDFVVYKRGGKEIVGVSYYAVIQSRSVTCELQLEAGEYIIFPRIDRYSIRDEGYFKVQSENWSNRKLTRVLTERAISRSVAANLGEGVGCRHFPVSIETLIEEDLQKLQEENQEVVEDDDNGDWQEENSDADEEEPEKEGDAETAEGDAENEGMEGQGPPGSVYQEDDDDDFDYFDDEDCDPVVLGVRIYTKGGVAVSVTGQVSGERIDEKDEDEDEDNEKEDKEKNSKKKAATGKKEDQQGSGVPSQ